MIHAIRYEKECEEDFIFCVLEPGIDSESLCEKLNADIEKFNVEAKILSDIETAAKTKHGCYKSAEEITGMEFITDRGKFPSNIPKGMGNLETAYPEIWQKRKAADTHNETIRSAAQEFHSAARITADEELAEARKSFIDKWPLFKNWSDDRSFRTMYGKFTPAKLNYFTQQYLEDAKQ